MKRVFWKQPPDKLQAMGDSWTPIQKVLNMD